MKYGGIISTLFRINIGITNQECEEEVWNIICIFYTDYENHSVHSYFKSALSLMSGHYKYVYHAT